MDEYEFKYVEIGDRMMIYDSTKRNYYRIGILLSVNGISDDRIANQLILPNPVFTIEYIDSGKVVDIVESETIEIVRDTCFREMAGQIGEGVKLPNHPDREDMTICIGHKKSYIPHFFVFKTKYDLSRWTNGACLMFRENRYYDHGKHQSFLDKEELTAVIDKLHSVSKFTNRIIWHHLIDQWNTTVKKSNYRISYESPITEYDHDTIKRFNDK